MPSSAIAPFLERAATLIDLALFDRRAKLDRKIDQVNAKAMLAGCAGGSGHYISIQDVLGTELSERAALVWNCLIRAHTASGAILTDTLRDEIKRLLEVQIRTAYHDMQARLDAIAARMDSGLTLKLSLDDRREHVLRKYLLEADMYVGALEQGEAAGRPHAHAKSTEPDPVTRKALEAMFPKVLWENYLRRDPELKAAVMGKDGNKNIYDLNKVISWIRKEGHYTPEEINKILNAQDDDRRPTSPIGALGRYTEN